MCHGAPEEVSWITLNRVMGVGDLAMFGLVLMRIENLPMIRRETKFQARSGIGERQMRAELDEKGIAHANSQVWEQMLAMNLEASASSEGFCMGTGHVQGTIQLSGAWTGLVEVRLAGGLAYQATATMLMLPVESVSESDILDAAKEIANMIAGVIKSSLPRPCSMAVPESSMARERYCFPAASKDTLAVAFHHQAGSLMVRVSEQNCL
jgi:chemotaxis protein CheX